MKKFNEALKPKDKNQKDWDNILDNINKKTKESSQKSSNRGKLTNIEKIKKNEEGVNRKLLQKQKEALQKSSHSSLNFKRKLDVKKLHPIFIEFKTVQRMKDIATYLVEQGYKVYNYKKLLSEETIGRYQFFESFIEDGKYVFRRTNKASSGNIINFTTLKGVKGRIENKKIDPFNEEEWGFEKIQESNNFEDFKIGDRVIYNHFKKHLSGKEGKILSKGGYPDFFLVEFDEKIPNGHDGFYGLGKNKHCWYCDASFLTKIDRLKTLKPEEDPFGEEIYYESKIYSGFEVGDRVKVIGGKYKDYEGTLKYVGDTISVIEFDEGVYGGHSGNGFGKPGHCRYIDLYNIENVNPKKSKISNLKVDPFGEEKWYESRKNKTKNYTDYLLEEYEGGPPAKPQVKVRNKTVEWVLSDEEEESPEELKILWKDTKLGDSEQ